MEAPAGASHIRPVGPHADTARAVIAELKPLGAPERANSSGWFFRTGDGGYGHGDRFFGVTVPVQRQVARRHSALPQAEIGTLLRSKIHECRLTALLILIRQYEKGDADTKQCIAKFYLQNLQHVNNWDLVDLSARPILGNSLLNKPRRILYKLAKSRNLWERRIAIIATQAFIREGDFKDCLAISETLLNDSHDLIHKAVGWMLREVGDKSHEVEVKFLNKHAAQMPRTMLRYAIEKFPEKERKAYLAIRPNK